MKKLILAIAIITSNSVFANDLCDLHKAKAELTSSILSSPYLYGASNENNTASIGIAYSLSGRSKGNLNKEIAEAKCELLASTTLLDEQQKWAFISIQKAGARAELVGLLKARQSIVEKVNFAKEQFEFKTINISDFNSLRQLQQTVDTKIAIVKGILAEPSQPIDTSNIKALLDKARSSDGKLAELQATLESHNAWDITFSAGTQKDLVDSGSSVSPFVGVAFKWSFGAYGASDSISKIRNSSEKAFSTNPNGYAITSEMLFSKVSELLKVEQLREQNISSILDDTNRLLKPLLDLNSSSALMSRKVLEAQVFIYESELLGTRARITKYSDILSKG